MLYTCCIVFPSTLILMLGTGFFLLITIDFVLIMFISVGVETPVPRPITEVKQRRARLVLGWVTAWAYLA